MFGFNIQTVEMKTTQSNFVVFQVVNNSEGQMKDGFSFQKNGCGGDLRVFLDSHEISAVLPACLSAPHS